MKRLFFLLFVVFPALSLAENSFSIDVEDSLISSLKNSNQLLRLSNPEIILPTVDGDKVVELEQIELRSENYKSMLSSRRVTLEDETEVILFEGREQDSKAGDFYRITLIDEGNGNAYLDGYYLSNNKLYRLEKAVEGYLVSNLTEEDVDDMISECGSPHEHASLSFDASDLLNSDAPETSNAGVLRTIELATEADYEYFQQSGSTGAANAKILSVLNGIDAIYRAQLNLTISVVFQNVWTTPSDPYTRTASSSLLSEFANYWSSNFASRVNYDLAHLFTGRDLDGGVVGVAYVSAVCSSFRYGLSQNLNLSHFDVVLTAHEIGHNLGSSHDSCNGGDSYIMCPSLVPNADTFSSQSVSSIANIVDNRATCLASDGAPAPTPVPTPAPTPAPTPVPVPTNNAPVLSPIGARTVQEGQALNFSILATDRDGDAVSYSATNLSFGNLSGRNYSFNAPVGTVPSGSSFRDFFVTFTATDGRLNDFESVRIRVTGGGEVTNQSPRITNPGSRSVREGQTLVVSIGGVDPEGEALTYIARLANGTLPAGASIREDNGTFTWTPDSNQAGLYEIFLTISDPGNLTASTSFSIEVIDSNSDTNNDTNNDIPNRDPNSRVVRGDTNNDGFAEAAVYTAFNGTMVTKDVLGNQYTKQLGVVGDIPFSLDYDGDGLKDLAVYSSNNQAWNVRNSSNNRIQQLNLGTEDAIPVVGNFDGGSRSNLGIFRPALRTFTYLSDSGQELEISIGESGYVPVEPCDLNGNGRDDIILYNQRGAWISFDGGDSTLSFGQDSGDTALAGYINGGDTCRQIIYRSSTGEWFDTSGLIAQFGAPFDVPVLLDVNGDGRENLALWREAEKRYYILSDDRQSVSTIEFSELSGTPPSVLASNFALRKTNGSGLSARSSGLESAFVYNGASRRMIDFSQSGARISSMTASSNTYIFNGDYDADGLLDRVTYINGVWQINYAARSHEVINWGSHTDVPVTGDYNGDGYDDIGVFRNGTWFILLSNQQGLRVFNVGQRGDQLVPADYNGDGITDPATVDSNYVWKATNGRTSVRMPDIQWGVTGDIPVVGDFDGDGMVDNVVFRPSNGDWYMWLSGGNFRAVQWGLPGDLPIPVRMISNDNTDLVVYRPSTGSVFAMSVNGQTLGLNSSSAVNGQLLNTRPLQAIR